MAGLVPAINVFGFCVDKPWMPLHPSLPGLTRQSMRHRRFFSFAEKFVRFT
jgi:hypothetical protein